MSDHPMKQGLRKIVSVNTSDRGGGAERVARDLHAGYRHAGLDAWLVVGRKESDDPRVMPFHASHHVTAPRRGSKWRAFKSKLSRRWGIDDFEFPWSHRIPEITGTAPDAVHLHNLHGGYFDLRALPRLTRDVPVFLTLHDAWLSSGLCAMSRGCTRWESGCGKCPDLSLPPGAPRDATALNWRRKARILRRSKLRVAAPSVWLMRRMENSILAPAVVERRVIPHGIDLARFRPVPKPYARMQLPPHVPREGLLLVFAANLARSNPYKDYATIRSAVHMLAQQRLGTPVHLLALGEEAETEVVGNVTLHSLPRATGEDLARVFQAADLYVHAAHEESFGLVLAEAMACGTPVVASAVGGIPEVVGSEDNGILVPPRDPAAFCLALRKLLEGPALRSRMGEAAARDASRRFCRHRMTRDYLAWIEERAVRRSRSTQRPPGESSESASSVA